MSWQHLFPQCQHTCSSRLKHSNSASAAVTSSPKSSFISLSVTRSSWVNWSTDDRKLLIAFSLSTPLAAPPYFLHLHSEPALRQAKQDSRQRSLVSMKEVHLLTDRLAQSGRLCPQRTIHASRRPHHRPTLLIRSS